MKKFLFTIIASLTFSSIAFGADYPNAFQIESIKKESVNIIPSVNPSIDERTELAKKVTKLTKDESASAENSRVAEFLEVEVGADSEMDNVVENAN